MPAVDHRNGCSWIYVFFRFVEAYDLYLCPWAEWLALGSSAMYIPFEVADLSRHPHPFGVLIIVVNVLIVFYM